MKGNSIPNTNEIVMYLHCSQCLIEAAERQKPAEQHLEVGWTKLGIQVWCSRHQMNVIHIDFEGQQHPANQTAKGAKKFTEEHRQKLFTIDQVAEQTATRPFHETIVEAISQASSREMEFLATLIKATAIPKGHDEIIAAWNQRTKEMCWREDEDLGVPANLLDQKETAAKKAASK